MCSISCCSCCPCYGPSASVAPAPAETVKPVTPVMPNRRVAQLQAEDQLPLEDAKGVVLEVIPGSTTTQRTMVLIAVVADAHVKRVAEQASALFGH